jgi:hypothetical protein
MSDVETITSEITYADLVLEGAGAQRVRAEDGRRLVRFSMRVLASPAGEMRPEEAATVAYDERAMQTSLQALANRLLDRATLDALGHTLADLLLPKQADNAATGVRELFLASIAQVGPAGGLRLRLRLPPLVAALPWEFVALERAGAEQIPFLALDPRIAITRHEPLPAAAPPDAAPGPVTVLAAIADSLTMPPLDIEREQRVLEAAIAGKQGVEAQILTGATFAQVQAALPAAEVFHFVGHGGVVERQDASGAMIGVGGIELDDGRVEADRLGLLLRGSAVRLAVLGGCETGRRDGASIWGGVAPALIRAEVPAVIANQTVVTEEAARAFSEQLYAALIAGLPLEQAVAAGRLAVFNLAPDAPDWGVAVLYMRAADGQLFAGAADPVVRDAARTIVNARARLRLGSVTGGTTTGVAIGKIGAGGASEVNAEADISADTVSGGTIEGVSIGEV